MLLHGTSYSPTLTCCKHCIELKYNPVPLLHLLYVHFLLQNVSHMSIPSQIQQTVFTTLSLVSVWWMSPVHEEDISLFALSTPLKLSCSTSLVDESHSQKPSQRVKPKRRIWWWRPTDISRHIDQTRKYESSLDRLWILLVPKTEF